MLKVSTFVNFCQLITQLLASSCIFYIQKSMIDAQLVQMYGGILGFGLADEPGWFPEEGIQLQSRGCSAGGGC
jgi:hypothetical protein